MKEFLDHLKKGEFRLPVCTSCGKKVWPPSRSCPDCFSKTSLRKVRTSGTLLEFAYSRVRDREGIFGLVEISGFRIVGAFENVELKEGMKVRMSRCGLLPDGTPFYQFSPSK